MVSLVNFHTNATSNRWHLWEIDLRFALNSTPGWTGRVSTGSRPKLSARPPSAFCFCTVTRPGLVPEKSRRPELRSSLCSKAPSTLFLSEFNDCTYVSVQSTIRESELFLQKCRESSIGSAPFHLPAQSDFPGKWCWDVPDRFSGQVARGPTLHHPNPPYPTLSYPPLPYPFLPYPALP